MELDSLKNSFVSQKHEFQGTSVTTNYNVCKIFMYYYAQKYIKNVQI